MQRSDAEARAGRRPRLLYLDNLRMVAITAIVVAHLSVTYGMDADWMYYEGGEVSPVVNVLLLVPMGIGYAFVMGMFFLIAGYFTPGAYDRKGPGRFLVDRLKRLGLPWLVYEVLINPLVHYAVDAHGGDSCRGALYDCQYQGTFWRYLREFPRASGSLGDGPVWFLEALLIFSLCYMLWRLVAARLPWLSRGDWLNSFSDRQARTWRWVALACALGMPALAVAAGALTGTLDERAAGGVNWLSLAYSLWEGFAGVSMVITILTRFRRRYDHQGRLVRAMSEASFAVYVIHPGIIVPLALALSGIQISLSLKFSLVAPSAVALCYLVAYGLCKLPVVRTLLG